MGFRFRKTLGSGPFRFNLRQKWAKFIRGATSRWVDLECTAPQHTQAKVGTDSHLVLSQAA
jgi:hypothetical protein